VRSARRMVRYLVWGSALTAGVSLSLLHGANALADTDSATIVQQRLARLTRLTPLRKLTVGPHDQYQGALDSSRGRLIFTRKSDLAPHLCVQDLQTGKITPLLGQNADSQDAALSPQGAIAFTYFKNRATGEICVLPPGFQPVDTQDQTPGALQCLPSQDGLERSSPFWKSERELGYLLSDPATGRNEIWIENLDTRSRTRLAEGQIWSPALSPTGQHLAYNAYSAGTEKLRVLVLHDLKSDEKKEFHFSLPGTSGFPEFDAEGKHLVFSHYLNDTNHDGIIDGNDNSVLLRISVSEAGKTEKVLPEQLTSIETNCSYPSPSRVPGEPLLTTCAFEGSLDLYEIPSHGVVPTQWTEAQLWNAHQTARSYGERILILNTLRSRFPKTWNRSLEERLFSNHYFAGDIASARFYASQLGESHALMDLLLEGIELKQTQPTEEITRSLTASVMKLDEEVSKKTRTCLSLLIRGYFRMLLNQVAPAEDYLKSAMGHPAQRDEDTILALELARWIYPRIQTQGFPEKLLPIYLQAFQSPHLSEESRLASAFDFLKNLSDRETHFSKRQKWIQKALNELKSPDAASVRSLLESEDITLQIIQAKSEEQKATLYPKLDSLISSARSNYFLRKAIGTRAIVNFATATDYLRMGFVATQWLKFTPESDTEFEHARELYAISSLDHGYNRLGQNQLDLASNYFYSSVSLTDDLESHAGYIHSMVLKKAVPTLQARYQNLRERGTVIDNQKFADAVLLLETSKGTLGEIDEAIQKLESMEQDRDHALRFLYLGSLQLERLLKTADGYDFSLSLSEASHRNLMLAYDLGRDNQRIRATALENLGFLHARTQNHGLASQFFEKRASLPDLGIQQRASLIWARAHSLIKSYQSNEAAELLASFLKNTPNTQLSETDRLPFEERHAFALLVSKRWKDAATAYRGLLAKNRIADDLNLARIQLAFGAALFLSDQHKEALTPLRESLVRASRLSPTPRSRTQWVSFDPRRIQLTTLGFISQLGTREEKLIALQQRESLLRGSKEILDSWNATLAQNLLQQADLMENSDPSKAARLVSEALDFAIDYAKEYQYISHSVDQTLKAVLSFGLLHPETLSDQTHQRLEGALTESIHAIERQPFPQARLDLQKIRLELLWNTYQRKVLQRSVPTLSWDQLTKTESYLRIQNALPEEEVQLLEKLAKAIL